MRKFCSRLARGGIDSRRRPAGSPCDGRRGRGKACAGRDFARPSWPAHERGDADRAGPGQDLWLHPAAQAEDHHEEQRPARLHGDQHGLHGALTSRRGPTYSLICRLRVMAIRARSRGRREGEASWACGSRPGTRTRSGCAKLPCAGSWPRSGRTCCACRRSRSRTTGSRPSSAASSASSICTSTGRRPITAWPCSRRCRWPSATPAGGAASSIAGTRSARCRAGSSCTISTSRPAATCRTRR